MADHNVLLKARVYCLKDKYIVSCPTISSSPAAITKHRIAWSIVSRTSILLAVLQSAPAQQLLQSTELHVLSCMADYNVLLKARVYCLKDKYTVSCPTISSSPAAIIQHRIACANCMADHNVLLKARVYCLKDKYTVSCPTISSSPADIIQHRIACANCMADHNVLLKPRVYCLKGKYTVSCPTISSSPAAITKHRIACAKLHG
ncbi:hypothetical protein J6590_035434 [Homalodisca vitripennis]|nr:hypothetical protein J6590_035434 [Homalodisca vitripennis]